MNVLRILCFSGLAWQAYGLAPDEVEPYRSDLHHWQVRHMIEVFTLPTKAAYELTATGLHDKALHERLIEALKMKQATLEKLMVANVVNGTRIAVEQIESYEYPTEFDPPQLPQTLALIDPGPSTAHAPLPPSTNTKRSPFNGGLGIMSTTTPTAFEQKSLGDLLELDSDAAEQGKEPRVTYALETFALSSLEHLRDIPTPIFSHRKLIGIVSPHSGSPTFLGTYNAAQRTGVPNERTTETTSLAFLSTLATPIKPTPDSDHFGEAASNGSLRIRVEAISLDKAVAHALLLDALDDTALHDRIETLITQQHAKRETTLMVRTQSGERTKAGNADEYISPTEFDPPQIPGSLIIADHQLLQDLRSGRQTGAGSPAAVSGGDPNGGFGLLTTTSPTAFGRIDLGENAEFDVSKEGDTIDAVLALNFTRLAGTVDYGGIKHPVVEKRRLQTRIITKLGRHVLLGTLNKPLNTGRIGSNEDDRVWLAFLRVTTK